jgi:hypothetical protein
MHDRTRRRGDDGDSAASGGGHVAPGKTTRTQLIQLKATSSGAPLPDAARAQFEGSLGADLSNVRVHAGASSAEAAEGLGARAFATGQDIHFGAGQYQPDDPFGMHLLAHEVAHTVQQGGTGDGAQMKLEVSTPGDAYETEADVAAEAMVRGAPASVSSVQGAETIQRFSLDLDMSEIAGSVASTGGEAYHHGRFGMDPLTKLGPGSTGPQVAKLQRLLGIAETGDWDEEMSDEVEEIRSEHGMPLYTSESQMWIDDELLAAVRTSKAPAPGKKKKHKKGGGRGFGR